MDGSIRGAEDFLALSKALKKAGDKDLRKKLHKALQEAVKEVSPEAEQALADALPYAHRGKPVRQVVLVKTGKDPGLTVGVRFGSKRSTNARLANTKGLIRHPVFASGDKVRKDWYWVDQAVPEAEGWFDKTYTNAAPDVRKRIEQAMQETIDDIVSKARSRGVF